MKKVFWILLLVLGVLFTGCKGEVVDVGMIDKNGQRLAYATYEDGSKEVYTGPFIVIEYNENRDTYVSKDGFYKKGLLDKKYRTYDTLGNLIYDAEFKNGKLNGLAKKYYVNGYGGAGNICSAINYVDDKKEGDISLYNSSGQLLSAGTMKNNKFYNGSLYTIKTKLWSGNVFTGILLSYTEGRAHPSTKMPESLYYLEQNTEIVYSNCDIKEEDVI